jgi:hypothetical protein
LSAGWLSRGDRAPSPLSLRLCDGAAVAFALWTLCCHALVVAGGNLQHLIALYAVTATLALFLWRRLSQRLSPQSPAPPSELAGGTGPAIGWVTGTPGLALRMLGLIVGVTAAIAISPEQHPGALWWITVAVLGTAALPFVFVEPPPVTQPDASRWRELALWTIAGVCLCVVLVVHRPDIDDAFYINLAVAAADMPSQPLMSGDTMLGVSGLPMHMPAHRIHSYELWNGALSYITGIPAIYCFHWIAAGLVAIGVPLSHARLFRLLTPKHWVWAVAVLVVVLLASGETHRSYGNFSFVRLWQGKAIYLFFFMPLVYAYGIRFALRPGIASWTLLCAAQIGALGCSSSAVWAAPAGALMALCCGLRPTRRGLATFAVGALASSYVLIAGWLLRGELQPMLATEIREFHFGAQFDSALTHVFGISRLLQFGVASVLLAWACWGAGLARRFAIVFPLAVWLVLLNPYWDNWVAANLTGPSFWRAMWSLPAPILMTLILVAPLQFGRNGSRRALLGSRVACVAAVATFALGVPRYSTFGADNAAPADMGIWLGAPSIQIPSLNRKWAALLTESVPPGSFVVAPPNISVWISTFHDRAYPLQTRRLYLYRHAAFLGVDDTEDRTAMTRYVGGMATGGNPAAAFGRGLDRYQIAGVCLRDSPLAAESRLVLQATGFRRTQRADQHEIWVREEIHTE